MPHKIKAIIFDMDGVLIDAKEWHFEALNRALKLFGLEIDRYDHLVTYDGLPTKKKLEMLSIDKGLPKKLHVFINSIKQQYTMELVHAKCKPVFYHEYALSRLHQEGYKIAVCSNAIRKTVALMLEKAALDKYVDFFLSNEDVSKAKPDPEIYNCAVKRLGLSANECLVVEDNPYGIQAAQSAGIPVMSVKKTNDVHYQNIAQTIYEIEHSGKKDNQHA